MGSSGLCIWFQYLQEGQVSEIFNRDHSGYLPLSIRLMGRDISVRGGRVYTPMNENTKFGIIIPIRARVPRNTACIRSVVAEPALPRDCGRRGLGRAIFRAPYGRDCCTAGDPPSYPDLVFHADLNDCCLTRREAGEGAGCDEVHLIREYFDVESVRMGEKILRVCIIDSHLNYLDEVAPFEPF